MTQYLARRWWRLTAFLDSLKGCVLDAAIVAFVYQLHVIAASRSLFLELVNLKAYPASVSEIEVLAHLIQLPPLPDKQRKDNADHDSR